MTHREMFGITIALGLLCWASAARCATHRVPSQYATIQAAMDVAAIGDTVLVAPGVYTDCDGGPCLPAVVFMKTGTTLISEGGPDVTTMRADTFAGSAPVVNSEFLGILGAEINGFLITASASGRAGVGALDSRSLTVRNCRFEDLDNYGLSMIAGAFTTNSLEVMNCVFRRCVGSSLGAGLRVGSADVLVVDCLFEDCVGGAMSTFGSNTEAGIIRDSTFRNTTAASALNIVHYKSMTIEGCLFERNDARPNSVGGLQVNLLAARTMNVRDCVFLGNISQGFGGAVAVGGAGLVRLEGNSIVGSVGVGSGAAVLLDNAVVANNVISSTTGGAALELSTVATGSCNLFWNNAGGNFQNYTSDATDLFEDPRFCDEAGGDLRVASDSPCLPEGSNGCGLIGALGQGCGSVSVRDKTWGQIKGAYR